MPTVVSVGFILDRLEAAIHAQHAKHMARQAAAARQSRWDRDERLNGLCGWIVELERARRKDGRTAPEAKTDAEIVEMGERALAAADPDELAQARALLAAKRQREA